MSISRAKFLLFLLPALAWGQGSQLPKYTIATLPSASSYPTSIVEVIDGTSGTDCTVGGGSTLVLCKSNGGAWTAVAGGGSGTIQASPQFQLCYFDLAGTNAHCKGDSGITTDGSGNLSSKTITIGNTNLMTVGPSGYVWVDGVTGSQMVRFGYGALANQTTGYSNTGIGNLALSKLTTGTWNVAVGNEAMEYATTVPGLGNQVALTNVAVGATALQSGIIAQYDTAFGANVLLNDTIGYSNDCSGKDACWSISTGYNNVAHGINALTCNNGFGNVAEGYRAIYGLTTNPTGLTTVTVGNSGGTGYVDGDILTVVQTGASGGQVTVIATSAGGVVTAVSPMTFPGTGYALANNLATTGGTGTGATVDITELQGAQGCAPGLDLGQQNTAVGYYAMENNNGTGSGGTGSQNVAIGAFSLRANTTGQGNVAAGINSLLLNTTGQFNTAIGDNACGNETTGGNNICIGENSGLNITTQSFGINIGTSTQAGLNGVAVGYQSQQNNTAQDNTSLGDFSLQANTTGASNTAVGINALLANTIGQNHTALGALACSLVTTGTNDTCIGSNASIGATINHGLAVGNAASVTGGFSQAIGDAASASGTNSVALGTSAATTCTNNCIAIGLNTTNSTANTAQIGDSSVTDVYLGTGNAALHVGSVSTGLSGCPAGTIQYPCLVAQSDLTGQSAIAGPITLLASATAGTYRLDYYEVVTTAATTSSALPQVQVHYTDKDSAVAQWLTLNSTNSGNTVGTTNTSTVAPTSINIVESAAAASIQYATANYASVGVTAMQYAVHVKLWYLGP